MNLEQSVLPVLKQLEYFEHYKIHLRKQVGAEKAEFIVRNALYIISMGTNDFLQNYFLDPTRPKQFSLPQFQNFLLSRFSRTIEVLSLSLTSFFFLIIFFLDGIIIFLKKKI